MTNNLAVTAQDFSPYCITAPANTLLPGGGGNSICGFYDVSPAKFGQSNKLVDLASKYGDPSEVFNGVDVSVTARLGGGRYVQAGLSTGSTTTDTCYANDQPQLLPEGGSNSNPRTSGILQGQNPWSGSTQFKAAIVMPLWWQLQASANYQNLAPISTAANASISNVAIVPSLGRDLAACGARTGAACTSQVVANIVLVEHLLSGTAPSAARPALQPVVPAARRRQHSAAGRFLQRPELELGTWDHHAVGARLQRPHQRAGPAAGQIRCEHDLLVHLSISRRGRPLGRPV